MHPRKLDRDEIGPCRSPHPRSELELGPAGARAAGGPEGAAKGVAFDDAGERTGRRARRLHPCLYLRDAGLGPPDGERCDGDDPETSHLHEIPPSMRGGSQGVESGAVKGFTACEARHPV